MIFNWNIREWIKLPSPPKFADKQRYLDLFWAALDSVKSLYDRFMMFREATLYKLRWTSQTIWLEKLLNDKFNNGNPAFQNFDLRQTPVGIYIGSPETFKEGLFRWNKAEERHQAARWNKDELAAMPPNDPRRKYRFNNAELEANNDFVVKVPIALFDVSDPANAVLLANMKAWVELYRTAGSRYTIENY